ncbi:MAG: outer membrane lipoprotein-sorting protein [Bacteroidetes bacterium]|nr:outer membrane lipoprotein-sorting protein [Bacteroidota bacterium]
MKKIFLLLWLPILVFAQSKNPDNIIHNLEHEFNKVKDYSVDVNIKVDVNFLKVPEMNAKIYFKQPDKIHIESEGFAMLPRDGLYTSPLSFLKNEYTAIYVRDEDVNGNNASVIKIIPLNDKGDLILTTLWIDLKRNVILKVESTTKTNGTFTLNLNYGDSKYPLPSSMIFAFNADKMNLPQFPPDENNKKKNSKMISGKVFISYSNYVVNKGIPDSVFEKKENNNYGRKIIHH